MDFEGSLTCLGADSGSVGNWGNEVNDGEVGDAGPTVMPLPFLSFDGLPTFPE